MDVTNNRAMERLAELGMYEGFAPGLHVDTPGTKCCCAFYAMQKEVEEFVQGFHRIVVLSGSDEQVQALIGADWLVYPELDDLIAAVAEGNEKLTRFDTSCFSGEYVPGVEHTYRSVLALSRRDADTTPRPHGHDTRPCAR